MELVLSKYRDPFTTWGDNHKVRGKWVADYFEQMDRRIHLRGFHYWLVSLGDVTKPSGEPYLNRETEWNWLLHSVLMARYQGIGNWQKLIDRKHPEPMDYADYAGYTTEPSGGGVTSIDDVIAEELESVAGNVMDSLVRARYRYPTTGLGNSVMVMYCEKNTMNEYIEPIAKKYGAIFQPLIGESSLERVEGMARRLDRIGKPVRVFYISDFDPSGRQMPVSVARKFEYFAEDRALNLKLIPLALTYEQVLEYKLPSVPTKTGDTRAKGFIDKYGDKTTELDALEALHPGELVKIICKALKPYSDPKLVQNVRDENARILQEITSALAPLRGKLEDVLQHDVEGAEFGDVEHSDFLNPAWAYPELNPVPEDGDAWLLDTNRSYKAQLRAYKRFKEGIE